MIDREARNKMVTAIRSFMEEKNTAFQFDEALDEAIDKTKDQTVRDLRFALWYCYDDLKDHNIVASKERWDYLNRILLLLESDGELEVVKKRRRWRLRNAIAAVCLITLGVLAVYTGFRQRFFNYAVPFGIVSMILTWWSAREDKKRYKTDTTISPFPSAGSILTVRRRVHDFVKLRYPKGIAIRRVRHPVVWTIMMFPNCFIGGMFWLFFSPIPLFFQMLPDRESEVKLILPNQPSEPDALLRAAHP